MSTTINIETTLDIKTCPFGHVYAVPVWTAPPYYTCPMCAKREKNSLKDENDALGLECEHRQRVIRSLRGALKRKKK